MSKQRKVVSVSVALSPDLARRARMQAAAEDKSRSAFVREVLEAALAARRAGQTVAQNKNHTMEVQHATS